MLPLLALPLAVAAQATDVPCAQARPVQIEVDGRTLTTVQRDACALQRSAQAPAARLSGRQQPAITQHGVGVGGGEEDCETANRRTPGSLLLYPEFDNRSGIATVFTVTHTSCDEGTDIDVEFVYRGRFGGPAFTAITNGGFTSGLDGWTWQESGGGAMPGQVIPDSGGALMLEGNSFLVSLYQSFLIPDNPTTLTFSIQLDPGFDTTAMFVPDAWEASLLDAGMNSVVPTWTGVADSFLNLQEDGTENTGSGTDFNGTTCTLDISMVPPGTQVTLFFDLIGGDSDTESGVRVDGVGVAGGEPVELECAEFNRTELLTPCDTLTVLTNLHNPQQQQGFAYAFAKNPAGQPVAFNHLAGQVLKVSGIETLDYSINAVSFRSELEELAATDVDGDGIRDLNGTEYGQVPDELLVPRFFGQSDAVSADLILVGLSGGKLFTTTVDFLIYNDNEEAFSANYKFRCWDKVALLDVSAAFSNEFLTLNTNHDDEEVLSGDLEYGWYRMNGGVAISSTHTIHDPAFYAVHVERIFETASADLPFERCSQDGHLLPLSLTGDNEE